MKHLFLPFLFGFISLLFSEEKSWNKSPTNKIIHSLFKKMTFRKPVVFTPLEIKMGYLYYGGENYSSGLPYGTSNLTVNDLPVILDSTQYHFNILNDITKRRLFFIEVDLLRTNLTHFIYHQNYVDLQMGLGFQMINFLPNPSLPSDTGNEWEISSNTGSYFFHPKSVGMNINTSLGWQFSRKRLSYVYHSIGISKASIYESEGGDNNLSGIGYNESFGIGTKFVFEQQRVNFNYTFGIEIKWNRLYMKSVEAPDDLSPIEGLDLRASGIFLTSGIQFGGIKTDGDVAYSQMIQNDYMSAIKSFRKFLDIERRHIKRKKAIEMLQFCKSQVIYNKIKLAMDAFLKFEFDESISWYDSAEIDANEIDENKEIINEIIGYRKKHANELLDSIINNQLTIANARKLAALSVKYYHESNKYSQVMARIHMDSAKLNTKINNYSGAIEDYQKALQIYPAIEPIIIEKLYNISNRIIKDAYLAFTESESYTVIKFMKDFIKMRPQMADELNPYIIKFEKQIMKKNSVQINNKIEKYVIDKKHDSIPIRMKSIKLGMSDEKVKMILGVPKHINQYSKNNKNFEMWTYSENSNFLSLYFYNKILTQIKK